MIVIKDWFYFKMKSELSRYVYEIMNYKVIGETEKAYKLSVEAARVDGEKDINKIMFCPKSCVMTEEELKKEQDRFDFGVKRYEAALQFAKDNGLKVRNKMKLKTILDKIKKANLVFEFKM